MPKEEEEYEVLDLVENNQNWVRNFYTKTMGDISRQSAAKQMGVGSVTGIVAGWLFVKVGKVAAATLGTTVLVVQVAQHQGYIKINWDRVRSHIREAEEEAQNLNYPGFFNNVKKFFQENVFLAVGFGGGFLVGMAV